MPLISMFPCSAGGKMKSHSGTFKGRNNITVSGVGFRPIVVVGNVTKSGNWTSGAVFWISESEAYTNSYSAKEAMDASINDDGFTITKSGFPSSGLFEYTAYGI